MVVGVDVSSRRIDLAWLDNGVPKRWHQDLGNGHLIDRLREIRIKWPTSTGYLGPHGEMGCDSPGGFDITEVAIEYPFAAQRVAIAALMATVGVITKQAPTWARVAWPSSNELRKAIGAKNTKASAHDALLEAAWVMDWTEVPDYDEHEKDALVAALGWANILSAQENA